MIKEIIIRPREPWWKLNLKEIWSYRELIYIFVWRDVVVRYKQTLLGVSWVVFQPLVTVAIFSIFFGKIAKIPSDNLPYPLFSLIGLIIWNYFSSGVSNASNSIVVNNHIISKVYFPRLIIPLASILTSGVDFVINLIMLLIVVMYYGFFPEVTSLLFLPLIFLTLIFSMCGLGFASAAINVKFRDVRYLFPFFIQIGLYLTPIIYPLSVINDYRRLFLIINPLTGVVETFRAVVSRSPVDITLMLISFSTSLIIFVLGLYLFRENEKIFVDIA